MKKETFGNNVKKMRQAYGFTQSYVADALGISLRAYINIERGDSLPRSYERYEALSEILHVDISDLWLEDLEVVKEITVTIERIEKED